ncbi:MAG TPA: signal peptidase I, partial [Geodermatophilus sp.]|nr:signal peptidase I [Geodermatophilus sp.]
RPGGRGGPVWRRARAVGLGALVTLVLLAAASVAGLLPLQVMRVDSGSMAPTIEAGDLLLVDHRQGPVHRGDVVAVENPAGGGLLVKRVVGVGGDRVGIEDGVLVVNGTPVCEPAIDPTLIDGVYFGPVTVPPGELFLLSDHRDRSIDSRTFGTVPASELVGFVRSRLWPSPGGLPTTGSC